MTFTPEQLQAALDQMGAARDLEYQFAKKAADKLNLAMPLDAEDDFHKDMRTKARILIGTFERPYASVAFTVLRGNPDGSYHPQYTDPKWLKYSVEDAYERQRQTSKYVHDMPLHPYATEQGSNAEMYAELGIPADIGPIENNYYVFDDDLHNAPNPIVYKGDTEMWREMDVLNNFASGSVPVMEIWKKYRMNYQDMRARVAAMVVAPPVSTVSKDWVPQDPNKHMHRWGMTPPNMPVNYEIITQLTEYGDWRGTIAFLEAQGVVMKSWSGKYAERPSGTWDLSADPDFADAPQKQFVVAIEYEDAGNW